MVQMILTIKCSKCQRSFTEFSNILTGLLRTVYIPACCVLRYGLNKLYILYKYCIPEVYSCIWIYPLYIKKIIIAPNSFNINN